MGIDKFMIEYEKQLMLAIKRRPDLYMMDVADVPTVVGRMRAAFIKGSYNKEGLAIKWTCKALNVPFTRAGIDNFVSKGERQ